MPTGSCICGEIKISYTGEPTFKVKQFRRRPEDAVAKNSTNTTNKAICYCNDDRKMSNVQTYQVPEGNFTLVAGTPKIYTKKSDFDRVRCHSHPQTLPSLNRSLSM